MSIFRFAFFVLAVIAAASLLGSAGSLGLAAVGAALFLPLLVLKVVLIAMLFGFFGRMAAGWGRHPRWPQGSGTSHRRPSEPAVSAEDRFEEWHRMAHAREEVDSWTPEI